MTLKRMENMEVEVLDRKLVQEPSDHELEQKVVQREKRTLLLKPNQMKVSDRREDRNKEKQFNLLVKRRNSEVRLESVLAFKSSK